MAETLDGNLAARIAVTLAVTRPPWAGQRDTGYWTGTVSLRRTGTGAAAHTITGTVGRSSSPSERRRRKMHTSLLLQLSSASAGDRRPGRGVQKH